MTIGGFFPPRVLATRWIPSRCSTVSTAPWPDDHRNEFLIFYIQPLAELGIALKDASENQDTPREKEILAAARERALKAFTVLED